MLFGSFMWSLYGIFYVVSCLGQGPQWLLKMARTIINICTDMELCEFTLLLTIAEHGREVWIEGLIYCTILKNIYYY